MIKYFTEAEENSIPDIDIAVQVGPEEDEEMVSVNPQEANPESEVNPVDEAKKNPNTIVVAQKSCSEGCCGKSEGCDSEECDDEDDDDDEGRCGKGEGCCGKREGCCEFYVDAADVAKYADLTEKTMLEALNDIIACNEESGIRADNLVVVVDESTACYVRNLEKNGAACVTYMNEAGVEDINIDVQVGPEKDERVVSADPQEANPVDAVKRQYDTVVVAKKGDDFFLDVEDVQKCAELNCEAVIDTLNGVISCNEEYDMNTENVNVFIGEGYLDFDVACALDEAGVQCIYEAGARPSDANGLGDLANSLIAISKKVAGKIKGDKEANSKAIQWQIDKLDKQIARMEEEVEASKEDGFKPKMKWAVKQLISYAELLAYFDAFLLSGMLIGGGPAIVKQLFKPFLQGTAIGSAIAAPATMIVSAANYRKQVVIMLSALKDRRDLLEEKLKKAKEKEAEK